MDTTVTISIAMLIIALLSFTYSKYRNTTTQAIQTTELQVKLANIEKELTDIKAMLVCSNEKYFALEKRVFMNEQKWEKAFVQKSN